MTKKIPGAIKGRPRAFDREAVLDMALRLFWRRGFEGTAMSDLVEELKIVAPSIYAAFGSKEDLFTEAIALYARKYGIALKDATEQASSSEAAVRAILLDAARTFTRRGLPAGCFVANGMLVWPPQQVNLARVFKSKRALLVGALCEQIEAGIAAGELPRDTDARALGSYFGAVIEGMSVHARDGATERTLRKIAEIAMQAWPRSEARAKRRRSRSARQTQYG
jgi:TetR/AcrR family transcriptional regulator, copper-responsive repressor